MEFYYIRDDYIQYLRQYDNKVAENKQESRPYVGVLLNVDGVKYYAPFTSPKPKHQKMKNTKDFRKINQGIYGAINFNNMIPIVDKALILIDIERVPDAQYKRLLQNQYLSISSDSSQILRTASNLHNLIMTSDEQLSKHDLVVKQRCCNLKVLESVYTDYQANHSFSHKF